MKGRSQQFTQVPLDIVGSTKFGRYPKISVEQTWNMIISDNFLVDYAGYAIVDSISDTAEGRGIYSSTRFNHMIAVIGNAVYKISTALSVSQVGMLNTSQGDVYITENNGNQIAICDQQYLYIYNYSTGAFSTATLPTGVIPGYVTFQDGYFIIPDTNSSSWYLSAQNDGTNWLWGAGSTAVAGVISIKPDLAVAAQAFPGRSGLLYVFGRTVAEPWQDVGNALFPYQRNQSVNIDYGCLSAASIAFNDNIMIWLAANEKSGPMIAYSNGGDIKKISTDGIDFQLSQLTAPQKSYGFLFRQDGHLIYQITFTEDNLTYCYDFNTNKFFSLCDQNMNAHIAKRVAFFNNTYYFVSLIDGNIYEMSTKYTTYNGAEIPRIRVCRPIRMPDASRFAVNNITFTIEEGTQGYQPFNGILLTDSLIPITTDSGQDILTETGVPFATLLEPIQTDLLANILTDDLQPIYAEVVQYKPYEVPQAVGLSVSKNGGQSFGTIYMKELNTSGNYRNRLIYWQLGAANDFTPQFRFWGLGRFVCTDGIASVYQ